MTEDSSAMPSTFDRLLGMLDGLPDTVRVKPATIRTVPLLGVGGTVLHIVQTIRQQHTRRTGRGDEVNISRDTIFLEHVSAEGTVRLVIPPEVADTIARQRDALGTMNRKKAARKVAADRQARGEVPGFLRKTS